MNALIRAASWLDGGELPTRRAEDFKWTDLSRALKAVPPPSPPAAVPDWAGPFDDLAEQRLIFVNGRETGPEFVRLEGERATLAVRFVSDAVQTSHLARLKVQVAGGCEAVVFESYEGRGRGWFADTVIEFVLEPGARLERLVVYDEPEGVVSVSTSEVSLAENAAYRQTVVTSGGRLQRHETHVRHPGRGASARLDGLYVLAGSGHADLTTVVTHEGEGGETSQLTKGVVRDRARGVFQGRIVVERGADKTDARMGHHALLLDDGAEVDAKPELEIYADDVACAHGNTVGALDEQALFYAVSRGIPEADARAMLTQAFLGEVIDQVEHEGGREVLRAWLTRRLGREG